MATQTRDEAAEKRSGAGSAAKRETRTTPALFFRQMVGELRKNRAGVEEQGGGGPGLALFFRQMVGELRKVIWPTRQMLVTYTVVCMAFVIFMVAIVTALDYGFTKLVFALYG